VSLFALEADAELTDGVTQALRDGIERGYAGETPTLPLDARAYSIEARGREVGVLALRLDWPGSRAATVVALAIDPDARGHSYAARALFTAERALAADIERWYATVPRTNGRGLYFMLRCGYAPLLEPPPGAACEGVTWFARASALRG
jgi:GNAT superfamily N-acetyltransferase